jgi:hypothetical protein
VVIAAIKSSLVLTVEFISPQDHLVQLQKALGMSDGDIPVNAIVFLEINPEFQYRHGCCL